MYRLIRERTGASFNAKRNTILNIVLYSFECLKQILLFLLQQHLFLITMFTIFECSLSMNKEYR